MALDERSREWDAGVDTGSTDQQSSNWGACVPGATQSDSRGTKAWIVLRLSTYDSQLLHAVLFKTDLPNNASYESVSPSV